jgi:ring-1,2-phenylacetyl-CoA epoxidase subunit PaaE
MALTDLLPTPMRRRLRRLRQDVIDVTTALTVPRRPIARTGALTDSSIYARSHPAGCAPDPSPTDTPAGADGQAKVFFFDHDTEVVVEDGQTILAAGLQAGLDLDFSCTVGGCAACALRLVEGEVVYDGPTCLSEQEQRSGMCLACVGKPRGRIVVESL